MTETMSEAAYRQYCHQRRICAATVFHLLHAAQAADDLYYDNFYVIKGGGMHIVFADKAVQITFDDPSYNNGTGVLRIAAPYTPEVIAPMVHGLITALRESSPAHTAPTLFASNGKD
jgi:hypothetical protein